MTPDAERELRHVDLPGLFGPAAFRHALRSGVIQSAGGQRVAWVSEDLLRGLVLALRDLHPTSWRDALHACGARWGERAWGTLGRELVQRHGVGPEALALTAWLSWIEEWFSRSGWGELRLDLTRAVSHGLIVARVEGSALAAALPDVDGADALLAGMLQALFEAVTGQALAAAELACATRGHAACVFVVSAPARVRAMRAAVEAGTPLADVLADPDAHRRSRREEESC